MRAELEILGLDVSSHVVDRYAAFLDELGATRSRDLLSRRSRAELLVAGVKVATQTPPVRSGRRVVFLTLDDATGPVDATFFEDAQGPYAATVFGSWLLVVRGELRRTGHRGVSLRATGAWELPALHDLWERRGDRRRSTTRSPAVPEGFAAPDPAAGCWSTPAASRCLPTPTSSRPATPPRTSRASSGTAARGARDDRPLAVLPPCPSSGSASERRSAARTAVVWAGLQPVLDRAPGQDVLDIGGGTGGFAVRVAELGHRVRVVDPSPDALAALDRRARESGVATGSPASRATCPRLLDVAEPGSADVVLCHGVLEVVDDPAAALATIGEVLRPGGVLSLLVAQRHAAVVARAMAGHFEQARALLDADRPPAGRPGAGSPATSSSALLAGGRVHRRPRSTPSGSSPTWCPARCSTSSPVPPPRWSSSSRPSPSAPSTSRSPPSSTLARRPADAAAAGVA